MLNLQSGEVKSEPPDIAEYLGRDLQAARQNLHVTEPISPPSILEEDQKWYVPSPVHPLQISPTSDPNHVDRFVGRGSNCLEDDQQAGLSPTRFK
jgi:hypothetical protein